MAGTEDEIERLRYYTEGYKDGRVHRWSRRVTTASGWPGHTTFVALKGGEVVVGDRYAGEGIERTYACAPASFLEGCFHELVVQQLGPRVLEELLAEVRRELGVAAKAEAPTKNAREPSAVTSVPRPTPEPASASQALVGASTPAPVPSGAKVVSAPSMPPLATPEPTSSAHVDVTVVACQSVSLPLAVALRGITRTTVHELLGRLRSLPCRVASRVPREQAEGLAARLAELGAEARLVPANGS